MVCPGEFCLPHRPRAQPISYGFVAFGLCSLLLGFRFCSVFRGGCVGRRRIENIRIFAVKCTDVVGGFDLRGIFYDNTKSSTYRFSVNKVFALIKQNCVIAKFRMIIKVIRDVISVRPIRQTGLL